MKEFKLITILLWYCFSPHMFSQVPKHFQNLRYDIVFNEISPNGSYVSFRKAYETSRDTIVVMKTAQPEVTFYSTNNVTKSFFTKKNTLFIIKRKMLEIFNFQKNTPITVNNISHVQYLAKQKIITVTTKNKELEELLIFDENGDRLNSIPNINKITITDNDDVFLLGNHKDTSSLYQLVNNNALLLYTTNNVIQDVLAADATHVVIAVQKEDTQSSNIAYLDKKNKSVVMLNNNDLFQCSAKLTGKKDEVYIQAYIKTDEAPKSGANIWYGNDQSIETKFYPHGEKLSYLLWNAPQQKVVVLNSDKYLEMAYVGSPRYYIAFNPFELQDYSTLDVPLILNRYDLETQTYDVVGKMGSRIYFDTTGNWAISKLGKEWVLVNIKTLSKKIIPLPYADNIFFSTDSRNIYFEQKGSIGRYTIANGNLKTIKTIDDFISRLPHGTEQKLLPKYGLYKRVIDDQSSLFTYLFNQRTSESALAIIKGGKLSYLVPRTDYKTSSFQYNSTDTTVCYISENLNSPPQLFAGKNRNIIPLFQSNKQDSTIHAVKKEIFNYYSSANEPISGLLIYPMNFDPLKNYPMIVNIYEAQSRYRNRYLRDGFYGDTVGFNIRHFVENGYFIFLPDIVYNDKGTGFSALDCVEKGLDAISGIANINLKKIGLIGHSHGAYETNFIATHSKRFAAYVSGAGNSDLVRSYFSYNYNFNSPFYWQFEDGQYRMPKPFFQDKELYIKNSPIQFANQVNAPILLWAGKKDENINWEQTMEFYLALRRSKRKVAALFYEDEGHVIENANNKIELHTRISEWFGNYLKFEPAEWIKKIEK